MKFQLTDEESEKVYEILGEDFFDNLERIQSKKRRIQACILVAAPIVTGVFLLVVLRLFS